MQTLCPSCCLKIQLFEVFFKHCFCHKSLVEISAKLGHIWGSKAPKKSVKGHFMDAALVCKTENFNLIATNAALMKLTIMYLHNNFNLQKVYWHYGSLVKMLQKLDLIWESWLWKTTQRRSKIIASGILTVSKRTVNAVSRKLTWAI